MIAFDEKKSIRFKELLEKDRITRIAGDFVDWSGLEKGNLKIECAKPEALELIVYKPFPDHDRRYSGIILPNMPITGVEFKGGGNKYGNRISLATFEEAFEIYNASSGPYARFEENNFWNNECMVIAGFYTMNDFSNSFTGIRYENR
jgi:hypothetical protein